MLIATAIFMPCGKIAGATLVIIILRNHFLFAVWCEGVPSIPNANYYVSPQIYSRVL